MWQKTELGGLLKHQVYRVRKPRVKQEHWHCAATLCTNSWRTKHKNLKYYILREIANCPEKRLEYNKILKNKGIDFKRYFICSAHWSKVKARTYIIFQICHVWDLFKVSAEKRHVLFRRVLSSLAMAVII